VEYKNGIVEDIPGLEFDDDTRKFIVPPPPKVTEKTIHASTGTGIERFYSVMKRYMKEHKARHVKMK